MNSNTLHGSSSPQSSRTRPYATQTLNRHSPRTFDNYGQNGMYGGGNGGEEMNGGFDNPRMQQDRLGAGMSGNFGYGMNDMSPWNAMPYGHSNNLAAIGATVRGNPMASQRGRNPLPSAWLDQPPPMPSGPNAFNAFGAPGLGFGQQARNDQLSQDSDEDLIPTAIVIKNIPFAVKKEQLVQVMTDLNLPLPYAFNYHFDNGVFRGLAFANFTTAEETAAVIDGMNHLELHGRKLRVEYKKMLPQAERDRIEREKRERRGQLEEQHRPMGGSLQPQSSLSSLNSHLPGTSPSPVSARPPNGGRMPSKPHASPGIADQAYAGLDMNDPTVLNYYSRLILFSGDANQSDVYSFPPDTPAAHRKIIHAVAHILGLDHASHGVGEQRQVHVYKNRRANGMSPTLSASANPLDQHRRQLNRAATTDFSSVRAANEQSFYNGFSNQSAGFLGSGEPQASGLYPGRDTLRGVKSFADLRSNNPSPAQSNSSFPPNLTSNIARFQEQGPGSPGSSRSNLTPTATQMPESLITSMGNMGLSSAGNNNAASSPHRLRGMVSWDRDSAQVRDGPGPIGGHRTVSGAHDDMGRSRTQRHPIRQPRGPDMERNTSFQRGRQNGHQTRGSDDLTSPSNVGIVVE